MPSARLQPILYDVRRRAAQRRRRLPLAELRRSVRPDPQRRERFVQTLRGAGLSFIAECKRRSPTAGALSGEVDLSQRARSYARGGAAAISVLTEQDHFGGSLEDLAAVEGAGLPRLRKDFLLDEGMLLESVACGADAVLLLATVLEGGQLAELAAAARELGLASLVEVHAEDELERALSVEPDALGVNARDLRTFEVDTNRALDLLARVPDGPLRVAESGLKTVDDLQRARAAGADAALVGEALMVARDPAATLAAWKEACGDG